MDIFRCKVGSPVLLIYQIISGVCIWNPGILVAASFLTLKLSQALFLTRALRLDRFIVQSSMQPVLTCGLPHGEHSALYASEMQRLEHQTPLYQRLRLCFLLLFGYLLNQLLWPPSGQQWQHILLGQSAGILHRNPYLAITPFQVPVFPAPLTSIGLMQTHLPPAQAQATQTLQICHPHGLAHHTLHPHILCVVAICLHQSTSVIFHHTSPVLAMDHLVGI